MLTRCCIVLLVPNFLLFGGCLSDNADHAKDAWLPHKPTAWRTTPQGRIRDAGPFASVEQGFTTDDDLDAAIDAGYSRYAALYPDYPIGNHPIALNDDYTLWVAQSQTWASGLTMGTEITVCIWTRSVSIDEPGTCFIKRAPGFYWGVYYAEWRCTAAPLAPALTHELLHAAIGDPGHKSPLWYRMN